MDDSTPDLVKLIVAVSGLVIALMVAYLPGYIAKTRRTRHARTISSLGFAGFLFPPLWLVAVVWACVEKEDANYGIKPHKGTRPPGYTGSQDLTYRD